MTSTLGLIANPAAGKDIRRLVGHAVVVSDAEKISILRRVVAGADAAGIDRILLTQDSQRLGERAVEGLDVRCDIQLLPLTPSGQGIDTSRAATAMRKAEVGAVVSLGGDGTQRDVVRGWLDVPLIPLSTGTNNVFPLSVEPTIAGQAAGWIATGALPIGEVSRPAKVIDVRIAGEEGDLGLVDVVLMDGRVTGSRAVWKPEALRAAVLAIADPASVGLSAIGGAVSPLGRDDDGGLALRFDADADQVRVPLMPGTFADIGIAGVFPLAEGEEVEVAGPGVLSFDGERDRVLGEDQLAVLTVRRAGPRIIDVDLAMRRAAETGLFCVATEEPAEDPT